MQPKKPAWSVMRKGTPTTTKKESWKEWTMLQDKKKKQVASSSDTDTLEGHSSPEMDCCDCECQESGNCCEHWL